VRGVGRYTWALLLAVLVFASSAPAFAQGGSNATTLSGVVVDSSGGVLPGVNVEAKENATGVIFTAVSDDQGRYTIPNIAPGTYRVKISLSGFKTFVAPEVKILTATPATLPATLEVGGQTETIVVTSGTEVVQTTNATVSNTILVNQIQKLPVITHTALDAVVFSTGVETVGSNTRGSTINGLPTTSIAITLDGINAQDKRGSEGFFMLIRPMMDSVEEITVSTSTLGVDSSGSGGATIRMTTRSGTNSFTGSAYTTWRNQAGTNGDDALTRNEKRGWLWRMNTPYWFNKRDLPKTAAGEEFINDVRLQTPGFRVGGPIVIPGVVDGRGKAFYFFNYEEFRLPESRSRTRTLLNVDAQLGNFSYPRADNGQRQTVNLLQLAGAGGLTNTADASIAQLLADIRQATTTTGQVRALDGFNLDAFDYAPSATQLRRFPTVKIDYNLTTNQRLSGTYRYNDFNSTPDFLNSAEAPFPGFPAYGTQISGRYSYSLNLNSIWGKWVNNATFGVSDVMGQGVAFNGNATRDMFACNTLGCQSPGQGFSIGFPTVGANDLTGPGSRSPSFSVTKQMSFDNAVTRIAGAHSFSIGGSWQRYTFRSWAQTVHAGSIGFGTNTNDPASTYFDETQGTAVFPGGLSSTYSDYAKGLYALLTGRVTSFGSSYTLMPDGTFKTFGETIGDARKDTYAGYINDTWRVKPNLTLTLGMRYQLEMPITTQGFYTVPANWEMIYGITGANDGGIYGSGNLYKPGTMTGSNVITVEQYDPGHAPYKTDYNNFMPSVQAAWRPSLSNPLATWLLGTEPVFRGGYSMSFDALGTGFFTDNYGGNIGRTRTGNRTATSGTPLLGFDGWPVLLRDTAKLYPSAQPAPLGENFTLTPAINESIDIHYPVWEMPHAHQYSFGVQRQLGSDIGIDVRYVGNTSVGPWTTFNMNATGQWSIMENGYYDEFRKAQQNLHANIVAGRGNTFAYTGAPGTSPLPIYMAYFQGIPLNDSRNQVAANYTASQFTTANWYNQLSLYNPNLTGMAGTGTNGLQNGLGLGTSLDVNRQAAGLPANFFMANPTIAQGSAFLEVNGGNSRFNALQVDVTKRLRQGLYVQANYAYAFGRQTWRWPSLRQDWTYIDSGAGSDHTFKATWTYELPFGQGKRFATNANGWVNGLVGGWEIDGLMRWQSGPKFNFGGLRLVGMNEKELQDMFKFYHRTDAAGVERIFMFPEDVINNSIIALNSFSATTESGYTQPLPEGRYFMPANGPDCVTYAEIVCPGTAITRFITGPGYFKTDLSFVKRVPMGRRANIEWRMDIFNVFDTINFTPTAARGSSVNSWQVTSAATDVNASQDPGGRITQFGLRFNW
jgi:hypothetical protein